MEINLDMSQANFVIDDTDTNNTTDDTSEKPKKSRKSSKPKKDTQHRKYQITINNPSEHGFSHAKIKDLLSILKSCVYWCMCDETGDNGTYHTHVYLAFSSTVSFSRIKALFPVAHIESAKGTSRENREYIRKEGKWSETEKAETNHIETFEEWGKMPIEQQGRRGDLARLVTMVSDGLSNYDIITNCPEYAFDVKKIDVIRNTILTEKYKKEFREVTVHYVFGETGSGKTRSIMERYGYENVFKVTDYRKNPFDGYQCQPVLLLDEYRSGFDMVNLLNYLDGYPLALPARYTDRVACYTTVYIVSNLNLQAQHKHIQDEQPETWKAFLRRIKDITYYDRRGEIISFDIDHFSYVLPTLYDFTNIADNNVKNRLQRKLQEFSDLSEFTEIIPENEN